MLWNCQWDFHGKRNVTRVPIVSIRVHKHSNVALFRIRDLPLLRLDFGPFFFFQSLPSRNPPFLACSLLGAPLSQGVGFLYFCRIVVFVVSPCRPVSHCGPPQSPCDPPPGFPSWPPSPARPPPPLSAGRRIPLFRRALLSGRVASWPSPPQVSPTPRVSESSSCRRVGSRGVVALPLSPCPSVDRLLSPSPPPQWRAPHQGFGIS